jgi:hypothetical protein
MVPGRLAVNNASSQRDTCRRGTLAVLFRIQRNVYVRDRAGAAAGCFTAFACHRLQLLREFASRQTPLILGLRRCAKTGRRLDGRCGILSKPLGASFLKQMQPLNGD